jgi:FMN phosphatase YigB (HAD superfamily)
MRELGVEPEAADRIGAELGRWPLFSDSPVGLKAMMALAPCVAMTNSDRAHGVAVQTTLGFSLSDWVCAEELGLYKPAPEFWHAVAQRRGLSLDKRWWHVSAYADYDLNVASQLGLTTVFVRRPHHRAGPADVTVSNLVELAQVVAMCAPQR